MSLSKAQSRILDSWLRRRLCPTCALGGRRFTSWKPLGLFALPKLRPDLSREIGQAVPVVAVLCVHCGHLELLSPSSLGLTGSKNSAKESDVLEGDEDDEPPF